MEIESILSILPPALLGFLQQQPQVQKIQVPAATTICQSGDQCESLVIILAGRVKVYRPAASGRSLTLYYVNENESCILTASCILNSMPFPAFAETMTEVQGLSVPPDSVKAWLKTEPLWQQYILGILSKRMAGLIELVNALAFQGLDERLAQWLLGQPSAGVLDGSSNNNLDNNNEIKVTHQFIAEELASSREVISRLLKEFEMQKFIQLRRGTIKIIDRTGLALP